MFRTAGLFFVIITIVGITFYSSESLSGEVKSLDLQSKDIRCGSCALTIKRAVSEMDGVKKADVSASQKRIHVEYDQGKVTENQIIKKINDAGYKVEKTETACPGC